MTDIPADLSVYKRTPEFSESTIPAGLLRRHSTKAGTWGRIQIIEGSLLYRILEPEESESILSPERAGIVEPEVPHEVAVIGPVRFFVEFLRAEGV